MLLTCARRGRKSMGQTLGSVVGSGLNGVCEAGDTLRRARPRTAGSTRTQEFIHERQASRRHYRPGIHRHPEAPGGPGPAQGQGRDRRLLRLRDRQGGEGPRRARLGRLLRLHRLQAGPGGRVHRRRPRVHVERQPLRDHLRGPGGGQARAGGEAHGRHRRRRPQDARHRRAHRQEALRRLPVPPAPRVPVPAQARRPGSARRDLRRQGPRRAPPRGAHLGRVHRQGEAGRRPAHRPGRPRHRYRPVDDGQLRRRLGDRRGQLQARRQARGQYGRGVGPGRLRGGGLRLRLRHLQERRLPVRRGLLGPERPGLPRVLRDPVRHRGRRGHHPGPRRRLRPGRHGQPGRGRRAGQDPPREGRRLLRRRRRRHDRLPVHGRARGGPVDRRHPQ